MSIPHLKAMFAAGCFWGVEEAFMGLKGVVSTAVGYAGGREQYPTYKLVCTGVTGHAEVVLVEFDPAKITYRELVDFFFQIHNPTTLNRQGPDEGTQYRSAIYFFSLEQEREAVACLAEAQKRHSSPIVTEITKAGEFFRAEEYHQKYNQKNGGHCSI